jgi:hypothetical protein
MQINTEMALPLKDIFYLFLLYYFFDNISLGLNYIICELYSLIIVR